jgi:hypothetical protein
MRSHMHPFTRRFAALTVALLLVAGLMAAVRPTPGATAAPTCDRAAIVNARLDALGRAGYSWRLGFVPGGYWGLAGYPGPRDITVSETAPCDAMVTIVNHEWMHTQQEREYPGRAGRAYGAAFEFVADCGSMLLGSPMMPYVERRQRETGQVGCTDDELASARWLLGRAR